MISIIMLIVLFPLFVVSFTLVRISVGSPTIFRQERPGFHAKPFYVYKFRTMTDERDENGELLPDDIRLTKTGKMIRKLSLDELPQLFNILKGDMSFVGPRPLLMKYLPYYTIDERKRHSVRPGITGLAQVKGRNRLSWDKRLALDVEYVEKQSLLLDIKIILLTIKKVFKNDGLVVDPRSVMLDLDEERENKVRRGLKDESGIR